MTAKKSSDSFQIYFHAFADAVKSGFAVSAVALIALIILIPTATAAIPETSIFNVDFTHAQMKYRFYPEDFSAAIHAVIIIFGIFSAVSMMKFMFDSKASDAYFSFGITRKKLILFRILAGLALIFFVIAIPMIISLILNFQAFGSLRSNPVIISAFYYILTGFICETFVTFSISLLICTLVGTYGEAVSFSVLAVLSPSILIYGSGILIKNLLFGTPLAVSASDTFAGLLLSESKINPILFFYQASEDYSVQYIRFDDYVLPDKDYSLIAAWFAFAAAAFIITLALISKRHAEIAGVSGQSKLINFFITFIASFLGFASAFEVGINISTAYAYVFACIGFAGMYILTEKLQKNISLKELIKFPIQLISISLFCMVLSLGGLGYSAYTPESDEIASVEVTYVGSPNYMGGQIKGISSGTGYYAYGTYTFTESDDIDLIVGIHDEIIEDGRGKLELNASDFSQTYVPYDISFKYTLKNGAQTERYYGSISYGMLESMLKIDDTQSVKASISDILSLDSDSASSAASIYQNGTVYISDSWYINSMRIDITDKQRAELLECLKQDITSETVEERYFPEKPSLGVIMFSADKTSEADYSYQFDNALIYIHDNFSNTIEFLKKYKLYSYFNADSEIESEIESVTLQKYDPYIGINDDISAQSAYFMGYSSELSNDFIITRDFGENRTYTDADKIEQLTDALQNDYFMSRGGYLASIKMKNSDKYVYKFLPAEHVPDFAEVE